MSAGQKTKPAPAPMPLFMTLSELDHRRLGARDWLTLLPAILLSVILNGIFLTALIVANPGSSRADSKLKNAQNDDVTKMEDKKDDEEKSTIDIFTPELDAPKDIDISQKLAMPSIDPPKDEKTPSLSQPPPEKEPIGGSGLGDDGKMKGKNAMANEGLRGDPILAEMGAVGTGGSLPLGGGAGITSGGGSGDYG